jgi:hypothetical protein
LQDVMQGVPLSGTAQPTFQSKKVFCDTATMKLIVAHNREGTAPVSVNRVRISSEPLNRSADDKAGIRCDIDPLSTKPYGLPVANVFVLDVPSTSTKGIYMESEKPEESWPVDPGNLLRWNKATHIPSLSQDTKITYEINLRVVTGGIYQVKFLVTYDSDGEHSAESNIVLVAK